MCWFLKSANLNSQTKSPKQRNHACFPAFLEGGTVMSIATMNDSIPRFRGFPVSLPSVSWFLERLPIVVLILSITFLQGYALSFWDGLLGRAGLGVSIGLEVLHIWFWYKSAISAHFARLSWIMLATVATGLLLAGALHEVSKPLLLNSARIETVAQQRKSLEAETRVLNANLAAFRDMAATPRSAGVAERHPPGHSPPTGYHRKPAKNHKSIRQIRAATVAEPSDTGRRCFGRRSFSNRGGARGMEPFGRQSKGRKTVSG